MAYEPDIHDMVIASIGGVKVYACGVLDYITIDDGVCNHPDIDTCATLTREEAIAAANAILKHFDQDWNAYEENISERYRALTEEEMAKFLAENPNYKPIPKEVCDPDAPLTSELSQNFGEE